MIRRKPSAKRVAARQPPIPDRGPLKLDPEEMESLLSFKVNGKTVRETIHAYLANLILETRAFHEVVRTARDTIENDWYAGDWFDFKDLRKGVRAVVEDRWGDDPALPVLVEMIALGKYLT